MAIGSTVKSFVWSLIMLGVALVVLFFTLAWLHNTFSGNAIGSFAGSAGARASGQSYQFK